MYIGLIDDDIRQKSLKFPNLEIMKLSSYYKQNRDIVELCTDYRTFERYSKIIIRKDKIDNDLPNMLLSKARGRCEYGGYAFTNGIYIPMPDDIEKSLPDVTIYDKIKLDKKQNVERFQRALKKTPIRLQTADKLYNFGSMSFLIYDKAATQYPLFQEVLNTGSHIQFTEKQEFTNLEEAVKLAQEKKILHDTQIHYKGTINAYVAKNYQEKFKVPIYFDLIPNNYKDVSFDTGCAILQSYFSKIEGIYRLSPNFKLSKSFKDTDLQAIIEGLNRNSKENSLYTYYNYHMTEKNYKLLNTKYSSLLNRIKQLRRNS